MRCVRMTMTSPPDEKFALMVSKSAWLTGRQCLRREGAGHAVAAWPRRRSTSRKKRRRKSRGLRGVAECHMGPRRAKDGAPLPTRSAADPCKKATADQRLP
jgi:hypothetical protein